VSTNVTRVPEASRAVPRREVRGAHVPAPRNFGLDLVRAVAISGVLAAHSVFDVGLGAFLGVELFFVLSGFLIGGILLRSVEKRGGFPPRELFRFLVRRWFRTLPSYYLILFVSMLGAHSPGWSVTWRYLFFVQNFTAPAPPFFGESWSLAVEEWFYLLFSTTFFLLALAARSRAGLLRAFTVATGLFLTVPAVLRFVATPNDPLLGLWKVVVLRLDAIMYGVLLALIHVRWPALWLKLPRLLPLGLAALVAAVALHSISSHLAVAFGILPASIACILPYFERLTVTNRLVVAGVQRLSVWSYSVYLVNAPIYFRVHKWCGSPPAWSAAGLFATAAGLLVILFVSAVLYRYFEKPVMNLRDRVCP
jgi:peptidoglycan/LPS O-acetylase OafA/YrhL